MGEKREMGSGNDVRNWDEDAYRDAVVRERQLNYRTVFRTAFSPSSSSFPDALVAASSDGSIAAYTISSCISSPPEKLRSHNLPQLASYPISSPKPFIFLQGHKGPAYDVKFYGEGEDCLLLSCGDDGRICGWRWKELVNANSFTLEKDNVKPVLDFVNLQHRGPWNALSAIPENNAIDVNKQQGAIFSAAGDACAYCWDVETGQQKMVFKGHSDYLHCIVACKLSSQILTGSEDGTTRIWDCKSAKCIKVMHPETDFHSKKCSWVRCIAIDTGESWLACGSGNNLSVWSLPSGQCIWNVDRHTPVQDTLFDNNQILAVGSEPLLSRFNINGLNLSRIQCAPPSVFSISQHSSGITALGGFGGIVDIVSDYGTHLCVFRCHGD